MLVIKLCVLVILSKMMNIEAARILAIYPSPSISHQVVFRPLTLELIKSGHEVTVVTTDPIFPHDSAPENLKEIDVHEKSYEIVKEIAKTAITGKKADIIKQARLFPELNGMILEEQMKVKDFQELINNKTIKYDLILLEAFYTSALGITHIFKAPTILVSSFGSHIGIYETLGAPTHPTLYHNIYRQRLYNLSLWEKATELYNHLQIKYIINSGDENANRMLQRIFGSDIPSLSVLKNNVDMLFLNIHPIWEGSYPVPPNVIYMWGIHQTTPKKLPKDLQQYLDASNNGVIYFSFGTNVKPSSLPRETIAIFQNVFSQLPYNIVWKWDDENLLVRSNNIKVYKWLPQVDLLRHPNVKLFITQGGLQSTDEAITAGVPLIGIPMLGDQWYNVEKYVYHKIGIRLDFENLSKDKLRSAILKVAEDKSYRNNIAKLRSLMQDEPQKPLERAMWWIEYVLRHGGAKHLRAPAANISWSEFLELELVSVIFLGVLVLIGLIIMLTRFLVSRAFRYVISNKKRKTL